MKSQKPRYDEEVESTSFKVISPSVSPPRKKMQHDQATSPSKASKRIHPKAPIVMVVSLILGVGFALAHHSFYNSRDGTSVGDTIQQEWYIRVGTYFAYLVTFALGVAIATAYTQQFWYSVRSRSVTVEEVDSLFVFLVNVTPFLDIRLWRGNFMLVLIAAIKWLAPVAGPITPGTLSVATHSVTQQRNSPVPQLSTRYEHYIDAGSTGYGGPLPLVSRLAMSSALQGSILNILAPLPDSSYTNQFTAPALQCRDFNSTEKDAFFDNTHPYTQRQSPSDPMSASSNQAITYLAWAGPAIQRFNLSSMPPPLGASITWPSEPTTDPLNIVSQANLAQNNPSAIEFDELGISSNWTMVQCSLQNASYVVDFRFEPGKPQHLDVNTSKIFNAIVPGPIKLNGDQTSLSDNQTLIAEALIDVFGKMMTGVISLIKNTNTTYSPSLQIQNTVLDSTRGEYSNGTMIQQLFQNMSLSLLTKDIFQYVFQFFLPAPMYQVSLVRAIPTNLHRRDIEPNVTASVTVTKNGATYYYKPWNLWLAYGSAILSASLCVFSGIRSLYKNGYSYNNTFSTVLRKTRGRDLDELVDRAEVIDARGANPLPEQISKALIVFKEHDGAAVAHITDASMTA